MLNEEPPPGSTFFRYLPKRVHEPGIHPLTKKVKKNFYLALSQEFLNDVLPIDYCRANVHCRQQLPKVESLSSKRLWKSLNDLMRIPRAFHKHFSKEGKTTCKAKKSTAVLLL